MMFQPEGMPFAPVDQSAMLAAFVKVPDAETPATQLVVTVLDCVPKLVARHLMLERFVQPENMLK